MMETLARNWWALALRGTLALLFGLIALTWPGITFNSLVLLFGVYALIDGVFAIASVVLGQNKSQPWWALLMEGVIGVSAAVVTFTMPAVTAIFLLYIIAFWAVATGTLEIAAAIKLRKEIRGEWALGLAGVLSIAFGAAAVASPVAGALAVAWMIGVYAVAFGIALIVFGVRLRQRGVSYGSVERGNDMGRTIATYPEGALR